MKKQKLISVAYIAIFSTIPALAFSSKEHSNSQGQPNYLVVYQDPAFAEEVPKWDRAGGATSSYELSALEQKDRYPRKRNKDGRYKLATSEDRNLLRGRRGYGSGGNRNIEAIQIQDSHFDYQP